MSQTNKTICDGCGKQQNDLWANVRPSGDWASVQYGDVDKHLVVDIQIRDYCRPCWDKMLAALHISDGLK